ncbi:MULTISPECIES: cyclopropane-fatty-acyl-phospholipid synthase family protein [unclassified Anabaena]|uniref:SAM-dependent methyltransferase n=1 Tax=unclassified Anabaena TaxID=2619674 RepID=UPI000835884E|nr:MULTISPECIES: methyltransferase domain-containing protein [unclassified Anabaena]
MTLPKILLLLVTGVSIASVGLAGCTTPQQDLQAQTQPSAPTLAGETQAQVPLKPQERPADVPYVPTPQPVVDAMLEVAQVNKNDVLYDLGSGDGRIVITAAQKYGTRGVGIDINPERIQEANTNAKNAKVTDRVQFVQQDLFNTDLSEATVVTLYLLPDINLKLRPKLFKELKPGTRVVSHAFNMGEWKPEKTLQVDGRTIYYWVIPTEIPANLR